MRRAKRPVPESHRHPDGSGDSYSMPTEPCSTCNAACCIDCAVRVDGKLVCEDCAVYGDVPENGV